MASNAPYPDHDAPMGGGPGLYTQNGGTSPAQQQQQMPSDADIQLQENLAQHLQRSSDMMQHQAAAQGQQMNALNPAHHHFQSPPRPTHSPQQMAQTVMSMEDHNMYSDHGDGSRNKRSKVSRACDECRRKKVCRNSRQA